MSSAVCTHCSFLILQLRSGAARFPTPAAAVAVISENSVQQPDGIGLPCFTTPTTAWRSSDRTLVFPAAVKEVFQ
jgi:hypothetical protein